MANTDTNPTFGFKPMSDLIAGYTFNTENFCRHCIISVVIPLEIEHGPDAAKYLTPDAEQGLDNYAALLGIEREDEHSFDSGVFPKTILLDHLEDDDRCANCDDLIADTL